MKSTFNALLEKFEDNLYPFHVKVPEDIYTQFAEQNIKRIIVVFNGSAAIHNAFLPYGKGKYYIKLNKATMKANRFIVGDSISVTIEKDTSKYGVALAEEMAELLTLDPEGEALFHKLTPGKIRSLLFKINNYKSSDKRIEKSVIILEHLKANDGVLDWKMLNEAFKSGFKL